MLLYEQTEQWDVFIFSQMIYIKKYSDIKFFIRIQFLGTTLSSKQDSLWNLKQHSSRRGKLRWTKRENKNKNISNLKKYQNIKIKYRICKKRKRSPKFPSVAVQLDLSNWNYEIQSHQKLPRGKNLIRNEKKNAEIYLTASTVGNFHEITLQLEVVNLLANKSCKASTW